MQMSHFEIFQSYRQAAEPVKQVKILAELNNTTIEDINEILKAQGVDYRKLPRPRKNKKAPNNINSPTSVQQKVDEPTVLEKTIEIPKEPTIEDITFFISKLKQRRKEASEEITKIDEMLKQIAMDCGFTFEQTETVDKKEIPIHEPIYKKI